MGTTVMPPSSRRPRFRVVRAYLVTARVMLSYAWLRVLRPLVGQGVYQSRLVELHRRNARRVERTILALDGLFIKVGQLISILTNFLPEDFRRELEGLQDQIPARPLDEITRTLRGEMHADPSQLFARFESEPLASASLAQVHEAQLRDGRRVAVKVQHADIDTIARMDLAALRRIISLVQFVTRLRGLEGYHADISQMIAEELDFTKEASNIDTISSHFAGDSMIRFPRVVPEISSRRVLVTELVDGIKVTDLAELEAHGIDRRALAQRILTAYCQMIFVDGVYHADPHPGNILVQEDGGVVFLDFGAVGVLSPQMKAGIPQFLEGVIRRDASKITTALHHMGFIPRDVDEHDAAERLIEYFQRKFLDRLTIDSWKLSDVQVDMRTKLEAMADLKKLDISFRDITSMFQVPREWVLVERTILLLLGLGTHLDPEMNPMRTIQPYLEEYVLGRDRDWTGLIRGAVKEMALSVLTIPEGVQKLLSRANRGELEVRVPDIRDAARLLYSAVHQLIFSALTIASAVMAYLARERGDALVTRGAGAAAVLFLLCLIAAVVGARRYRR
jgi:ubiquinone biosynthesis protein